MNKPATHFIPKNDVIVIIIILIISLSLIIFNYISSDAGTYVTISIDGRTTYELPLNTDTTVTIPYKNNYNKVIIDNSQVYVSEADCPDKICLNHRKIQYAGESIVCLPHKLVVEIKD